MVIIRKRIRVPDDLSLVFSTSNSGVSLCLMLTLTDTQIGVKITGRITAMQKY